MKTLIQKAGKILCITLFFISVYATTYAQSTRVDTLPVTDPLGLDVMLGIVGVPWPVPPKVVSVKIQAWGSGGSGAGGGGGKTGGAGGGGGGGYVEWVQTSRLSGVWYYVVGPAIIGRANHTRQGSGSWVNFHGITHPSDILANGIEALPGSGGQKPATGNAPVDGGGAGSGHFPFLNGNMIGGYGGIVIDGEEGEEGTPTSSGRGGNSGGGATGGASVPRTGGNGRTGTYPGGGGGGAFVNNGTDRLGGDGAAGKIVFTITFIDAPTASSQTLCIGSTISNLVTSNTFAGATIKWYEQASGGTALAPTTLLSTKTYYVSQTYRAENGDADVESDRTAVSVTITPTAGTISGTTTVCTGTNSTLLTLNGSIGTVQWQSSTNGTTYTNITNATRLSYTFTNLTSTTHYRAVVTTPSCGTATTAAAIIYVKSPGSWIGAVDNDWNNAGNWCGSMPNSTTNVTISSEPTNQPFIGNADVSVRSLTIAPGARLEINSDKNLNVFGNWINNGTFTANAGTVSFKGATQVIGGTNTTTFNNISIEGGGSKILSKNIEINGSVSFTSGYIASTNSSALIFKAGSRIAKDASDASFAKVLVIKYGTTDFEFPVGGTINGVNRYRPIEVSDLKNTAPTDYFKAEHFAENPLAAFQYFGVGNALTIFKDEATQTLSEISNLEFWNLSRSNPSSIADVTMDYSIYPTSAEKAQFLRVAHYDENEFVWENAPTDFGTKSSDFIRKKLKVTKVKNFSPFTTAEIKLAALPVTLSSFTAKPTPDNKVSLSWVTSSEIVNKGFRIERQAGNENGKYEQIGFVASKAKDGNSQNKLTYNFIDVAPKVGSASFYRLVQEDLDRKLTYSEVRVVKLNGQNVSMVFPNPSNGPITISRTADGKKMNVQVIDLSGKIISQANNITDTNYRLYISQSGVYTIKISYPETGEQSIQRIVIQK